METYYATDEKALLRNIDQLSWLPTGKWPLAW
jgi:hypothetical protein